ncbi:MAG: tyrosine-type recombinase/integrase [Planctomycetaceae bacterium]|jgi:integrase|nr:tyrosine-type recombinase/integrase [Planctomycetaceae bacterium]
MKTGSFINDARFRYVADRQITALLDVCKTPKERLLLALARYGGLRIPSELAQFKKSDGNWERHRFTVPSPKTERKGKASRQVPIFPELRPYLLTFLNSIPDEARLFPELTPETDMLYSFR